ncbi:hypothetical protein [Cryptosporangium japonicum]|uniref:hypothetical protein n=1 Tax=Cryptosporangium japonicum TaxID=80872 RepID=UPI0031DC84CA
MREAPALIVVPVGVALSVALHGRAHGHPPTPLALLAGTGLLVGPALPLTGAQRGAPVIVGALTAARAGLHVVFSLGVRRTPWRARPGRERCSRRTSSPVR